MTTKLKICKGDTVQVTSGADKGKKGKVIEVSPTRMQIKVEGVKVMTHFDKKDGQKKLEGFFDYSNVKLVEKKAGETKKKAAKKKNASKNA
ncbi:MAG: KOW motif-containing protein [Bdellovibrio sp.]|jgi:large subunit ribosomal protein L24